MTQVLGFDLPGRSDFVTFTSLSEDVLERLLRLELVLAVRLLPEDEVLKPLINDSDRGKEPNSRGGIASGCFSANKPVSFAFSSICITCAGDSNSIFESASNT